MYFIKDLSKLTKEFVYSKKLIPSIHPSLFLNNLITEQTKIQRQLDLNLDQKLSFYYYI